jgi:hypothetical protein
MQDNFAAQNFAAEKIMAGLVYIMKISVITVGILHG